MQAHPHEIAIGFFDGRWNADDGFCDPDPRNAFSSSEEALQFLHDLTGEQIGQDAAEWEEWFANCPPDLLRLMYDGYPMVIQSLNHPDFPKRLLAATERWQDTTARICSKCTALCPEYREHCWACGFKVGRASAMPE